ncbi:phosphate ABC transporter permease subunit PstC [Pseudomonas fluorescens]|uniref:Phosphate transport system permease protein n=1 Tax=Pseudomonas fluorescens TaxID=294 RepID=A0A944DP63_PSEFL|nr:phosphate ABC transporter permease subunit PstC [Pseudomonas fluorescens]MBT2295597.1 phosphate ABC transporter permease subunit PstC [Pseudomonas fluorescens]MBT2310503.1 phosphate ABC transporter permease subunit PstC [Pseudomonas fluorescens]MBT2314011.1 phosphate ABC transporter permease subunit PstC [Pseudomonas fluorescens]MBT2318727.1 phosphate ABC transporter permease subunit PstC [Pseudomonas fluorescens]MBT2329495.1 phosphate ABC transporter permease subunit PstC [Pseudomonas fluo
MSPLSRSGAITISFLVCGMTCVFIMLMMGVFIFDQSYDFINSVGVGRVFTDRTWNPDSGFYNFVPMIMGTLLVSVGAIVIAAPIGLGIAIFCNFHGNRWAAGFLEQLLALLAGVPSVVYGLWGLMAVTPIIYKVKPPGASLLAGILILALMIIPTVGLIAKESIRRVPASLINGAAALGLSRERIILSVVLPSARAGLYAAVTLALGRALGETMAVLMVTGNVVKVPTTLFDPIRTLAANIALEMAYAADVHRSALFASGLALMLLVIALVLASSFFNPKEVMREIS